MHCLSDVANIAGSYPMWACVFVLTLFRQDEHVPDVSSADDVIVYITRGTEHEPER